MSDIRYAQRVTIWQAWDHFDKGGDVLVSTSGAASIPVGASTTVHSRDHGTFEDLRATVQAYPSKRQRYYIVEIACEHLRTRQTSPDTWECADCGVSE